jgi:glycerophosphoryl diester phosphodiesterase
MLRPLVNGHRGAPARAPENTPAAFGRARRDGADGVESDVRLAAGGRLRIRRITGRVKTA